MRVTIPVAIDDTTLTDCSIDEPDTSTGEETLSGTYDTGERAISTALHWEWESAIDGNTAPLPTVADESNASWLSVGPTNRYRAFDYDYDTASTGPSPLSFELTPGVRVNAIGLIGMVADSVTITGTSVSGGGTVYSYSADLTERDTLTWSDYFYGEFEQIGALALFDAPPYTDIVLTITFTKATGNASIGAIVVGRAKYLGDAQLGAQSSGVNFSEFNRTQGGKSKLTRRRMVPKIKLRAGAPPGMVKRLLRVRSDLNAVPALWSWLEDTNADYFEAGLILGVWKVMDIDGEHHELCFTQYEIEGH